MTLKDKMINEINNLAMQMINEGCSYREVSKKTGYSISKLSRIRKNYVSQIVTDTSNTTLTDFQN
jgi:uncharacterized protein YerC